MGIDGSSKTIHVAKGLSIHNLIQISRVRCAPLVIDIDISWLSYFIGRGKHEMIIIGKVSDFLITLAKSGFTVNPICDGFIRHHSKRASIKRVATKEKARIDTQAARCEGMVLSQKIVSGTCENIEETKKKLEKVNKDVKKFENASWSGISSNFSVLLDNFLDNNGHYNADLYSGAISKVKTAKFQADSILAYRAVHEMSSLIVSADSDFAAFIGKEYLAVRDFKFSKGRGKSGVFNISDIKIGAACEECVNVIENCFENNSVKFDLAPFPVFDEVDIRVRGLIALSLGCDVFLSGIKNTGPSKVSKFLGSITENKYNTLLKFVVDSTKMPEDSVLTLLYAMFSEPCNYHDDDGLFCYLFEPTDKFPRYLELFTSDSENVRGGPEMSICCGVHDKSHPFLIAEGGFSSCVECDRKVCLTCIFEFESSCYCSDCYVTAKLLVYDDVSNGRNIESSVADMRKELKKNGWECGDNASPHIVEEIYDHYVSKKSVDRFRDIHVKFPVLNPNQFSNGINSLFSFEVKDGGRFISDKRLDNKYLPGLVDIFASLVLFDNKKYTTFDSPVYEAIPTLLVDFAYNSREGAGYRLLRRCLRHSMDPKGSQVLNSSGRLFVYENEIGLHLNSYVPASMKNKMYSPEVAITNDSLLYCACSCECGGRGDERAMCVHVLPLLYKISLLLVDGLAEHILLELNARLTLIPDDEITFKKSSIILLMAASGEKILPSDSQKSVTDLLLNFSVGTDKRKKVVTGYPDPAKLGPIRNITKMSVEKKARLAMGNLGSKTAGKKKCASLSAEKVITGRSTENMTKTVLSRNILGHFDSVMCSFCNVLPTVFRCCQTVNASDFLYNGVQVCGVPFCAPCAGSESISICKNHLQGDVQETNQGDTETSLVLPNNKKINTDDIEMFTVNYMTILLSFKVIGIDINYEFLGQKLLKYRADKMTELNINEQKQTAIKIKQSWSKLLRSSKQRSTKKHRTQSLSHTPVSPLLSVTSPISPIPSPFELMQSSRKESGPNESDESGSVESTSRNASENLNARFNALTSVALSQLSTLNETNQPPSEINTNTVNKNKESKRKDTIRPHRTCCVINCKNNDLMSNLKFINIQPPIEDLPADVTKRRLITHATKKKKRKLLLARCGLKANDERKNLRMCSEHESEIIVCNTTFLYKSKLEQLKFKMIVPIGNKNTIPTTDSKGLGSDRQKRKMIEAYAEKNKRVRKEDLQELLSPISNSSASSNEFTNRLSNVKKRPFETTLLKTKKQQNRNAYHEKEPSRFPFKMNNTDIKRRTGFTNEHDMLAYIIVICNGDFEKIELTVSAMTWYEEWFFFFEFIYGRTLSRWIDACSDENYGLNAKCLQTVFDSKLRHVLSCRASWPEYASYEEDFSFMSSSFQTIYQGRRIVEWDNTNVDISQSSCAELQRLTYSSYYAGNVLKGGVSLQLCGWLRTHYLWTGAVSDTIYNGEGEILNIQKEFSAKDPVGEKIIPFTNLTDKGYRILVAAWQHGNQLVLQPDFKSSDTKFSSEQTISSAMIASHRSSNERGVKYAKLAGSLSRGKEGNADFKRIDDIWLCWAFQCNFMYKTVL